MSKESEISVLALTLCWSAEPLKVALKFKMISTACVITSLFERISVFERVVEWTVKDSIKDSLSHRYLVPKQWNCINWQPVYTPVKYQQEKFLV